MSIATVDDLTALEPGVEVVVTSTVNGKAVYAKAEDGRLRHQDTGAMIRPEMFVGSVAAGAVRLRAELPPEVDEVLVTGTYHYLVLGVDGDAVTIARFRREAWLGLTVSTVTALADPSIRRLPQADHPAWIPIAQAMAASLHTLNQQHQSLNAQYQALHTQPVPERLVADLHRVAAGEGGLDDVLAAHGIGRQRMHTSTVRLWGYRDYAPSIETVRNTLGLGDGIDLDIQDPVAVRWERTVDIERQGVGCTCGEIDDGMFQGYIPPDSRDVDWEVNCA